ncbi:phosphoglucosamine mutase [Acidobacteriota bacterium]
MNKLFGTDGIRARAGQFPLDYSTICRLGMALISLLKEIELQPRVLVGRDTRESGEWLEQALLQGITENGGEAVSLGIVPTSAVSLLTKENSFSAGIVISASHNPYQDNGIKIFSSQGIKIPESWEGKLERTLTSEKKEIPKKETKITQASFLSRDYLSFLQSKFPAGSLMRKIKIILDCSNGASSFFAPKLFSELGFEVIAINKTPDGQNINSECGSLYPENLAKKVLETNADIGIAYDGDADRAIWVDEKGKILNGDHTLFVLSQFMKEKKLLKSDYVVATTMSNIGLEEALKSLDIKLFRTEVGDRYVFEQMKKLNANLGGEQSGHTIFLDDCPTGDGILTSIKMIEVMITLEKPLSKLTSSLKEYPQVLNNVRVEKKENFHHYPEIINTIEEIKSQLENSGRMNVRYSGTEPLARIMIEGKDQRQIEKHAQRLANVIDKYLGL